MIDDVSFAAWSRAFNHLSMQSLKNCIELPVSRGCHPIEFTVSAHAARQVDYLSPIREGHERLQWERFAEPQLINCQCLQVSIGADRVFQLCDIDAPSDSPHEWLSQKADGFRQLLATFQFPRF